MTDYAGSRLSAGGLSPRQVLKAATADAHARLHEHPFFQPLSSGQVDECGYRRILERLFGFHLPLEDELFAASRCLHLEEEMADRRRGPDLRDDLEDLGCGQDEIDLLPQMQRTAIGDEGRFFGALYVREGSMLGGALLAKRLDGAIPGDKARRFLSGHGRNPGSWNLLVERIQEMGEAGKLQRMVDGAVETFSAMETWLSCADEKI